MIATPPKVFSKWNEARAAGFFSKTHWKKQGKGVKGRPSAIIEINGEEFKLYSQNQTTTPKPRTVAAEFLLDRFVRRQDIAGYQPHRTQDWKQFRPNVGLRNLVKSGWDMQKCYSTGVGQIKAQAFSVRTAEKTNFFCIDLDCHDPTPEMARVHLSLVQAVVKRLPELLDQLGGGSTFAQYRQIETSGIQLWGTTSWEINTKALHRLVRDMLVDLGADFDRELKRVKLARLNNIEIAPNEQEQVSIPGCYGKTVFTTKELKVTEGWFDVLGLADHISKCLPLGEVIPRYSELMRASVGLFQPIKILTIPEPKHPHKHIPLTYSSPRYSELTAVSKQYFEPNAESELELEPDHTPPPRKQKTSSVKPKSKSGKRDYWTKLTELALNGLPEPDDLFNYSCQLARGLLFRDYFNDDNRHELAVKEIMSWLDNKNNGEVTRIKTGRRYLIEEEVKRAVSLADSITAQAVRDYWASIRKNDLIYPQRVELLQDYMRDGPQLNTSFRPIGKCTGLSRKSFDDKPLPKPLEDNINQVIKNDIKSSPSRKRFNTFSQRFINSIANNPGKSISWQKLNEMLGKKGVKQRTTQNQFKKILVKAGILKPDWERTIIRNQSAAKYSLTEWAKQQMGI